MLKKTHSIKVILHETLNSHVSKKGRGDTHVTGLVLFSKTPSIQIRQYRCVVNTEGKNRRTKLRLQVGKRHHIIVIISRQLKTITK